VDTNRPFQFQKRSQLFIHTHNEPLSVAGDARLQSRLFAPRNPKLTPKLHPAFLRLSAMISQYFTRSIMFPSVVAAQ